MGNNEETTEIVDIDGGERVWGNAALAERRNLTVHKWALIT